MQSINNAVSDDKAYQVVAVEKIETPVGMDGENWYRYVIEFGNDTIVGNRRGTHTQVMQHANECAKSLSSRSVRVVSSWTSRNKK